FTSRGYSQDYHKSLSDVETAAIVMFSLGLTAAIAWWIVKLCVWHRRDKSPTFGYESLIRIFVFGYGTVSEMLFWLMFIFSSYFFLIYKGQKLVYVLLPEPGSLLYEQFKPILIASFIGLLLALIQRIWHQMSVDVVFIDWEEKVAPASHEYATT